MQFSVPGRVSSYVIFASKGIKFSISVPGRVSSSLVIFSSREGYKVMKSFSLPDCRTINVI